MATPYEVMGIIAEIDAPGVVREVAPAIAVDHKDGIAAATLLSLADVVPDGTTAQDYIDIVNKMQFWLHVLIATPDEGEGAEGPGP